MANIFDTFTSRDIGTTLTLVGGYTANSISQTTVIGLTVANKTNQAVTVDVTYSDGTANTYLVKNAPLSQGSAFVPVGGDQKIVLTTGYGIKVASNTVNSIDATMSALIITG
ncbi:hypothetical protein [Methanohalobium sp.]|uniref:hypothetical protein n=1 Tax=Methanohalobium sp. TaxID=2837493 RepID=UPI0025CF79A1|nr:hypothetical protein [Methanohalobium sp.]